MQKYVNGVDTNILVYAHRAELPKHQEAAVRLTALAEGRARWALPVFVLGEFLRVITLLRKGSEVIKDFAA